MTLTIGKPREKEQQAREARKKRADSFAVMIKAREILALAETVASLWGDETDYSEKIGNRF